MSTTATLKPVLILGAGINGCALARELVLNGVPVYLVDQADIATGATAKSSRLIHGGIRYLEYGDFALVAESLRERERLLKLVPQFVRPLQMHIPVSRRLGGLSQAAFRFFRLSRFSWGHRLATWFPIRSERGLLVARIGLKTYDWLARSSVLPNHSVSRIEERDTPAVDAKKYRWLCSYFDAQMLLPERFVLALLEDARRAADETGTRFHVLNYHRADFKNGNLEIRSVADDTVQHEIEPSAIVNATGAWGDFTLKQLGIASDRLVGGTKGSHFITPHPGLREALGEGGVYAETADGRLVFILPFRGSVLVGTTDERFPDPPERAVASDEELCYLIDMVNEVFPQVQLGCRDVASHYSGVRPLFYVAEGRTGSIPRGHWIHSSMKAGIPVETLIGGKLTTCRAVAEEIADRLFEHLPVDRTVGTEDRPVSGAERFPTDADEWCQAAALETGFEPEQVAAVFRLVGTRAKGILTGGTRSETIEIVPHTNLPVSFVDWSIKNEWVRNLGDLVERRLGLIFSTRLSREALSIMAERLCRAGLLDANTVAGEIDDYCSEIQTRYGISIVDASIADAKA